MKLPSSIRPSRLAANACRPLLVLSALFIIGSAAAQSGPKPALPPADSRPNIVLLIADDLGWGDLSAFGHPSLQTPNLDRMAAEGQRWTNFYVSASTCSPSRGAILTGRAETRTGLYGVRYGVVAEDDPYGFPDRERTVAAVLNDAGYRTALFGKWHLGDAPRAYPTRHGFDEWWGLPLSNDAMFVGGTPHAELRKMIEEGAPPEKIWGIYMKDSRAAFLNPDNRLWNQPLMHSRRELIDNVATFKDVVVERPFNQITYHQRLVDRVVGYINQPSGKPFFAYVGFEKPHLPHFASPEFAGKSRGGPQGDSVAELDHSVGRIFDALRQSGKDKNTLVVFISDNGPWILYEDLVGSAGIFRDGKFSTYEGGVRTPAIFWQPGRVKPAVVDQIGSTYEFMPTFAALAATRVPEVALDGFDMLPALYEGKPSPRQVMPYYSNGRLMAWRDGDWKLNLIETTGRDYGTKPLDPPTLYNLMRDPSEKFNQAQVEPAILERLTRAAHAFESSFAKLPPEFDRRVWEPKPAPATPAAPAKSP